MREDLFNYVPPQGGQSGRNACVQYNCNHCGKVNDVNIHSMDSAAKTWRPPRRGNMFSQYTRKFSLGNGPSDWVQEYLITKEGGKMLGTLVALTVARMPNLETFIWDVGIFGSVIVVVFVVAALQDKLPMPFAWDVYVLQLMTYPRIRMLTRSLSIDAHRSA